MFDVKLVGWVNGYAEMFQALVKLIKSLKRKIIRVKRFNALISIKRRHTLLLLLFYEWKSSAQQRGAERWIFQANYCYYSMHFGYSVMNNWTKSVECWFYFKFVWTAYIKQAFGWNVSVAKPLNSHNRRCDTNGKEKKK